MSSQTMPSLTSWAQTHIAELYESSKASDFHSMFYSTFSSKAEIYTNHSPVTLDAMEETISAKKGAAAESTVEWKHVIEVPVEEGDNAYKAGLVAGYAVVTRSLKFRIRAAPAQMHTYIMFNAKIEQDPTVEPDEHGDRRRIVHLFETTLDKAAPIHFQQPRTVNDD